MSEGTIQITASRSELEQAVHEAVIAAFSDTDVAGLARLEARGIAADVLRRLAGMNPAARMHDVIVVDADRLNLNPT